jgi:hypothetical protein
MAHNVLIKCKKSLKIDKPIYFIKKIAPKTLSFNECPAFLTICPACPCTVAM